MKDKKQLKKLKAKDAGKRQRPILKVSAPDPAPEAIGPPLAGEALELKVAEVLCGRFRKTEDRAFLRKECKGADHTAIETAIVSTCVQNVVKPVAQASALEHAIAVLQLIFFSAKAALESKKPTAAQITALKIVFEVLVEKMMAPIGDGLWKESTGLLVFSDYEKSLIENLLQTVRGQRTPVAEDPQRAPDSGQNDEKGD